MLQTFEDIADRMMAASWKILDNRILASSFLRISFQRYPKPRRSYIENAPASHGALPISLMGAEAVVPIADDEAVWIGLMTRPEAARVLFRAGLETNSGTLDATTGFAWSTRAKWFDIRSMSALQGIPRTGGGFWAITRVEATGDAPSTSGIRLEARCMFRGSGEPQPSPGPLPQHSFEPSESGRANSSEASHRPGQLSGRALTMRIAFVSPATFQTMTSRSWEPLDQRAVYGGWRLP